MLTRQKAYLIKGTKEILSGREAGKALADTVLKQLADSAPDTILPLDFSKVEFIDFSCADEFLTKILRRVTSGELGTRFIVIQGMSQNVEENIAAVLVIRELVCAKLSADGKIQLMGKIGTELIETYTLATKKGKITANDVREIAPRLGISAISNRLARLHKMGLLLKIKEIGVESGGRQFIYIPVG